MDTFKLVKELLYLWVDKIVENLEKLTTEKQKEETKDAMQIGMAMNDDLPPVVVEQIHTMPPLKEEDDVKLTSGEVGYIPKHLVEISKEELDKLNKLADQKKKDHKKWRENNKEKVSSYNKEYYQQNREKILEQQRKYYEKKQEQKKQEQKDLEQKFNNLGNFSLLP